MADVFISYSHEDFSVAETLAKSLKLWGFKVWWDDRLLPHQNWNSTISAELAAAAAAVVIWSKHSVIRDFVQEEASRARNAGKLVNTIDVGANPDDLPMPFGRIQAVAVHDVSKIIESVQVLITRGPHASVKPAPSGRDATAEIEAVNFYSQAIALAVEAAMNLRAVCNEDAWQADETYRRRLMDAAYALETPLALFRDRLPYPEVTSLHAKVRLSHLDRITKPVLAEVQAELNVWLEPRATRAVIVGARDDLRNEAEELLSGISALA